MAFHWKTAELVKAFKALPGIKKVEAGSPGGDYDTTNIYVDGVHVSGYPSTEDCCTTPDDAQCQWIEITDGGDSRGGLNSKNPKVVNAYCELRKFFSGKDVQIINHYDEIF